MFGLLFGSFYLVVATRLPKEESIVSPGSHCDNCKHELKWYELIPVISYIIQGGKCRKCGAKIPFITVLIEVITAAAFCLSYYLYGFGYGFFALIILLSLSIIIFISDFKYLVILDWPLFISTGLIVILKYIYFGFTPSLKSLISGIILVIFMLLVKIIGDKVYKKESLGWGDVKLALFMGVVLGLRLGFAALIIGSFIALPYAIYYVAKKEEKEIPYGPFLITAVLLVFIFTDQIAGFINSFFVIS